MDNTLLIESLFGAVYILLWGGLIFGAITIVRAVYTTFGTTMESEPIEDDEAFFQSCFEHRGKITTWVICLTVAIFFSGIETAFRPKTTIEPNTYETDQRLDAVQKAEPVVLPQTTDKTEDWGAVRERNRKENADALKKFNALPEN